MPNLDILTLLKEVLRLVKLLRPKLAVVKHFVPVEDNKPIVAVTNLSDRPVTVLDMGFAHARMDVSFSERFVQPFLPRVKFPHTLDPGATLAIRIGPGAEDLWETCDVYAVAFNGRRLRYKCEPKFSAAR